MSDEKRAQGQVQAEEVHEHGGDGALATLKHADDALLAKLGYRSEFRREFSLIETIAFAFSIMGVVASVSSTMYFPLISGGHVGMVFGWLIPSLFVMTIAASLAELTSAMPYVSISASCLDLPPCKGLSIWSGRRCYTDAATDSTSAGLYYFSAKLAPPRWAPLASWITGWANVTGQVALVCSIDFTCAQMITTALSVGSDGAIVLGAGPTYGILLAILFTHGIVCSAATWVIARLNIFYVLVNVGTTIAAIVLLLTRSGDRRVSTSTAFTMYENNTGWSNNAWAFLLAFTAPMWTLTGYDSAAHISEETAGAARAAPIAILVGVGATASLGWLLFISASFAAASVPDLLASPLPLPMGQLFLDILGKHGMLAIWSLIIVVQYVTGAAQGVDASRVVFAFARDNALPGSRWWKRMHPYTRTPVNAVWLVIAMSGIIGLLGFSETALSSLAGASVIGLYVSYVTPIFLRITSGRDKLRPGPFSLGKWYMPIGIVAVAWVSFITVLLMFPPEIHPTAETMNYAVVIIMSVFVFASVSWIFSARKWFKGPVRTVEDHWEGSSSGEIEQKKAMRVEEHEASVESH
ncbi:amino acid transporter [Daedaleopsis nitida]|nr:amino acid transporter [Daedaleopsis nitida]